MTTCCKVCPECGSTKRFYHCYQECSAESHIVTCRNCKTCYVTSVPVPKNDLLDAD